MSDGTPHHVQEPQACPFVALADDRDRRLDVPDDRHRCYAEPHPQPRAMAHQESYCLAPAFSACPVFLDWAARAAADPVATRRPMPTPSQLARPTELPPSLRPTDPASREWAAPPPWTAEQLGAFDGPPDSFDRDAGIGPEGTEPEVAGDPTGAADLPTIPITPTPGGPAAPSFLTGRSRIGQPVGSHSLPPDAGRDLSSGKDPVASADPLAGADASRPPRPSRGRRQASPAPQRPQDRPEWSQPRRHEAYPTLTTRMGLRGTPPIAIAAVLLGVAALALFLLPGFLAGGDPADPTPPPSVAAVATPTREPTPTPEPTPQVYTVASGDNMLRIARMFGLTIEQIACFNGIADVNRLQIGQELLIPADDYECPGGETQAPGTDEEPTGEP